MKTAVCSRSVANHFDLTNHRSKKRKVIMHHTQGVWGFESLILHHTVRTRTRFFTRKGSGTFFVYRRFCGRTTRNGKRAKAGYRYDSGILPFVLRDQVRFVRTWSSPLYGAFGGNRCVRAYRESVYTSGKV